MPRSGYYEQKCPCGAGGWSEDCVASVTLFASSLHKNPRRKAPAKTIYVCRNCAKHPKPETRRALMQAVLAAVRFVTAKQPA